MASFTDTQPPRFNPYIQQLPVEQMAQVGMQKQQAYEQGVQRIQTEVDNIAGLDVVRDVDKAYLQSKLNELGNSLRTVSAGDFSNFQLVNSVSGMTKQIIRDEGVQNGVNSAAKLRKEQAFMEEERKKGELHPANEYVFNKQAGSWMNSSDLKQGFNAKYDKFFDVDKFMKETFSALKPDGFTIDQIFKTDGQGNPIYNKATGGYELSTTMSRLKKEGMFPEKVQQTIDHVFNDPRVGKQLGINGQYQYRGTSTADLASRLIETKDTQVRVLDTNIMNLTMKKSMIQDGVEREKISSQIADLVDSKAQTMDNYNNLITNIGENADAVRGMLYKAEEKSKYAEMYTNVTEERTVLQNPAWQANFDMQKEQNEMTRHADKMRMDQLKMQQDERIATMKMANDFNIANLKSEKETEAALSDYTTGDINTPSGLIEAHRQEGVDAWNTFTKSTDDLFLQSGMLSKDYLKIVKDAHPGMDDTEAMKLAVNNMAKKAGMSPTAFRTQQYNRAIKMMNDNHTELTPEMSQMKSNVEKAGKVFKEYTDKKALIEKAAPMKGLDAFKNTVDFKSGYSPTGTVTREDQMNLALYVNGGVLGTQEAKDKASAARQALLTKGYTDERINFIIRDFIDEGLTSKTYRKAKKLFGGSDKPDEEDAFVDLMDAAGDEEFQGSLTKRSEAIKKYSNYAPSVSKSLDTGKAEVDKNFRQKLKGYAGRYAGAGQNEAGAFRGNLEKITEVLEDDSKGSVMMVANKSKVTGEIIHKAVFYDAKGEGVGEMVISPDEAASVNFHPELKYSTPEMRYVENKMAVTQNNSSAYGDVRNKDTYVYNDVAFTKDNFPKLQGSTADVKGNIKLVDVVNADGSTSPMYFNYLYVKDKGIDFIKALPAPKATIEEAIQAFQTMDASYLNTLIAEQQRQKGTR